VFVLVVVEIAPLGNTRCVGDGGVTVTLSLPLLLLLKGEFPLDKGEEEEDMTEREIFPYKGMVTVK
jgi:hypothetical protein